MLHIHLCNDCGIDRYCEDKCQAFATIEASFPVGLSKPCGCIRREEEAREAAARELAAQAAVTELCVVQARSAVDVAPSAPPMDLDWTDAEDTQRCAVLPEREAREVLGLPPPPTLLKRALTWLARRFAPGLDEGV